MVDYLTLSEALRAEATMPLRITLSLGIMGWIAVGILIILGLNKLIKNIIKQMVEEE